MKQEIISQVKDYQHSVEKLVYKGESTIGFNELSQQTFLVIKNYSADWSLLLEESREYTEELNYLDALVNELEGE